MRSPTPLGVGGLKSAEASKARCYCGRPTPLGVGGLKSVQAHYLALNGGPTPLGVGGLKCNETILSGIRRLVPPRSGWVD